MAELAHRRCWPLLGTFVEIAAPTGAAAAVDAAFAAVAHVHARMSFHEETSDLAAIRRARAGETVAVDAQTVVVLRAAAGLFARSGGLFDVTVAARLVHDGFLPAVPAPTATGDATDIEIVDDTHVRCRRPVLIDLGGVAKGFAVDMAVAALASHGVRLAVVNAGGDLRVLGDRPQPVTLRNARGVLDATIDLADAALASSSNVHLRRRRGGGWATPHHGRAGCIVADEMVTVVAPTCLIADAMTKVALADGVLAAAMLAEQRGAILGTPRRQAAA